jgi:hypothetical protein
MARSFRPPGGRYSITSTDIIRTAWMIVHLGEAAITGSRNRRTNSDPTLSVDDAF